MQGVVHVITRTGYMKEMLGCSLAGYEQFTVSHVRLHTARCTVTARPAKRYSNLMINEKKKKRYMNAIFFGDVIIRQRGE